MTSITPRIWPDGSLGCPQPGQTYAPNERPGYVIELRTMEGETYRYHTDQERVMLCEEP